MTATVPDVDVLEAIDWEPSCERADCETGLPARWIDIRYCGCTILKCDPCTEILRADLKFVRNVTCAYCGYWFVEDLADYIVIEPLNNK